MTHTSFRKKFGLVVPPLQSELSGFDGAKSLVQGVVTLPVEVGKWQAILSFHVVNHGAIQYWDILV